jgi:hypothetical protein
MDTPSFLSRSRSNSAKPLFPYGERESFSVDCRISIRLSVQSQFSTTPPFAKAKALRGASPLELHVLAHFEQSPLRIHFLLGSFATAICRYPPFAGTAPVASLGVTVPAAFAFTVGADSFRSLVSLFVGLHFVKAHSIERVRRKKQKTFKGESHENSGSKHASSRS